MTTVTELRQTVLTTAAAISKHRSICTNLSPTRAFLSCFPSIDLLSEKIQAQLKGRKNIKRIKRIRVLLFFSQSPNSNICF